MKYYNILKKWCQYIYWSGTGNYWYEEGQIGNDKGFYKVYSIVLLSTYGFMTILEIMAAVLGDFPEDEKSDSVTFAVSHTIVMIKITSVIYYKDLIKSINRDMVKVCAPLESEQHVLKMYRTVRINVIGYFVTVYASTVFFAIEGLRKMFYETHFVLVVTYYPTFEDNSPLATSVRVITAVIVCLMMMTMIVSVDSFTMGHLIMVKYKFITLRHYYERLAEDVHMMVSLRKPGEATDKLHEGLIKGANMHAELIRLCKDIDKAFGTVMALQLCQSSGSAVSLLLQIATSSNLTFASGMKIIFFVIALFFLLALFLCNAGEITYQSSLISDSIFYTGWHACGHTARGSRRSRLPLLCITLAQRPLTMKAFNMIELTYSTFLSVLNVTYSVFALFYTRKT